MHICSGEGGRGGSRAASGIYHRLRRQLVQAGGDADPRRDGSVLSCVTPSGNDGGKLTFSDVSAMHWAAEAIAQVAAEGLMKGYPDGTFRPGQTVTRAEAVTMMNRSIGRAPVTGVVHSSWADVDGNQWAVRDIEAASAVQAAE